MFAAYLGNNTGTIDTLNEGDELNWNEGLVMKNYGLIDTNKNVVKNNYGVISKNWTGANVDNNMGEVGVNLGTVSNKGTVKTNYPDATIYNSAGGMVETNKGIIQSNRGSVEYNDVQGKVFMYENGIVITNDGNVETTKSDEVICNMTDNNGTFAVSEATASVTNNAGRINVSRGGFVDVGCNKGEVWFWNSVGGVNGYDAGTGIVRNNEGKITLGTDATVFVENNSGTISGESNSGVNLFRPYEVSNETSATINNIEGFNVFDEKSWIKNGACFTVDNETDPVDVSVEGATVKEENGKYTVSKITDSVRIVIAEHKVHVYGAWAIIKEVTCTENGTKERRCKICGESEYETITAQGHKWNDPTYSWSEDYGLVVAKRSCINDSFHVETETVETLSEETKPASYTDKGQTTYIASFSNPAFTSQTKVVSNIPELPKKNQTMIVKASNKTVKAKAVKKKARVAAPLTVANAKGAVTYKVVGGNKKSKKALKLNTKTGIITIKKKTKKGTYKIKVTVTASGDAEFKSGSSTVWATVKVK